MSLVLIYIANNVDRQVPFSNFLDGEIINALSFVVFVVINIIGILHASCLIRKSK